MWVIHVHVERMYSKDSYEPKGRKKSVKTSPLTKQRKGRVVWLLADLCKAKFPIENIKINYVFPEKTK